MSKRSADQVPLPGERNLDQAAADRSMEIDYDYHYVPRSNTPKSVSVGLPIGDVTLTANDHAGRMLCNLLFHKESNGENATAGCYQFRKSGVCHTQCKCLFNLSQEVCSVFFSLGGEDNAHSTTERHRLALSAIQQRYLPLLRKVAELVLPIARGPTCNASALSNVAEEDLFIKFLTKVILHSTNTSMNVSPNFSYCQRCHD